MVTAAILVGVGLVLAIAGLAVRLRQRRQLGQLRQLYQAHRPPAKVQRGPFGPAPSRPQPQRGANSLRPRKTRVIAPYSGPQGVAGWLVSLNGSSPFTTSMCDRAGEVTLGADRGCGVVIDDPLVSATHAVIVGKAGYFKLVDSGSRNGVFVDGVQVVGEQMLTNSARITLGSTVFLWLASEPLDGGAP